jgi:hypothetical protein
MKNRVPKIPLKQRLNDYIKSYSGEIVSHNTIKELCKTWGYRESNAERRLRPSESPNIERVMKKGYIIGYRYEKEVVDKIAVGEVRLEHEQRTIW